MKTIKFFASMIVFLTCGVQVMFAQRPTNLDGRKRQMDSLRIERRFHQELLDSAVKFPCFLKDDDEWITAFVYQEAEFGNDINDILLQRAQQQIYMKLGGKVKQMTTYYFDHANLAGDKKTSNHIENLCQKEVNQFVMETRAECNNYIPHPSPYKKDKYVFFLSAKVRKIDILKAVEEAIKNDEEAKLRYNEQKMREAYSKFFEDNNANE